MCDQKPASNSARRTTESGVVYYDDTPAGHQAATEDQRATQGGGDIGETTQPPTEQAEPPEGCENYDDSMWDKPCSKYFKFSQMKYKPQPNGNLTAAQVACNWQKTCQNILDPMVDAGFKITISSGYRTPAFDKSLGGSGSGDHTYGRAVDIQVLGQGDVTENAKKLFKWAGVNLSGVYSQIIFEGRWVHVAQGGTSPASVAVLVTRNGKAPYQNGGGRSGSALPPDLKWA